LCFPADQELCEHNREANDQDAADVDDHEGPSAILARDIREPPHVPETDSGANSGQNEACDTRPTSSRIIIQHMTTLLVQSLGLRIIRAYASMKR